MKLHGVAAGAVAALALAGAPAALAADGDLYTGFSGDGQLVDAFDDPGQVEDSAVDANGNLVVVGNSGSDIGVARITPSGALDSTFGGDGRVEIDSGVTASSETARGVAIDAAGNIVLVGDAGVNVGTEFVLARLTPTGALDASFDGPGVPGNGVFRISEGSGATPQGNAIAVSGTRIVFGGMSSFNFPVVYQLNGASGSLDGSFGTGGRLAFNFGPGPPSEAFVFGLGIQPSDGKIVAVGKPNNLAAPIAAARITTTGALDTATFNSPNGWVRLTAMPAGYFGGNGNDVTFDPSGGIYIGGYLTENTQSPPASGNFPSDPVIAKLTTAGALDSGFGTGGFAILPVPGSDSGEAHGIARQPDGKLIIGGSKYSYLNASTQQAFAARFDAAGVLDPTFNPTGSPAGARFFDHGSDTTGYSLALSDTGVAYVAGGVGPGFPQAGFGVAALKAGMPDPPAFLGTDPASPSDSLQPKLQGSAQNDADEIWIYDNAQCTGTPVAEGTPGEFNFAGIPVTVAPGSDNIFWAVAIKEVFTSDCSSVLSSGGSIAYDVIPSPPAISSSDPPSGANDNTPKLIGTARSDANTVEIFTGAGCSGAEVAEGSATDFTSTGIEVSVADNSTTTFYARAVGDNGPSGCSPTGFSYTEVTPPAAPMLLSTNPASGANNNSPTVKGTAPGADTVELFANSACSGPAAASGSRATFEGAGLQVTVPDNSTTTFYARAIAMSGTSPCSTSSITYSEVTPAVKPPAGSTGQRAKALKKCAKVKSKQKKRKCKRRARRLPV